MKTQFQRRPLLCWLSIALFGSLDVSSAQNLGQKGYKSLEAYSASDNLALLPTYAPDRTLCNISIQRKAFSDGVAAVDLSMDAAEVERVLSKLIPEADRGRQLNSPNGNLKLTVGNAVAAISQYEHVTITRYSGPTSGKSRLAVVVIHYNTASCADE